MNGFHRRVLICLSAKPPTVLQHDKKHKNEMFFFNSNSEIIKHFFSFISVSTTKQLRPLKRSRQRSTIKGSSFWLHMTWTWSYPSLCLTVQVLEFRHVPLREMALSRNSNTFRMSIHRLKLAVKISLDCLRRRLVSHWPFVDNYNSQFLITSRLILQFFLFLFF